MGLNFVQKLFLSSPSACWTSGASNNRDCVINGGDYVELVVTLVSLGFLVLTNFFDDFF